MHISNSDTPMGPKNDLYIYSAPEIFYVNNKNRPR